ncbi:MAG TPA: type II toxin-antitoxin system RelE/ParE family toxin [Acetobacteraceae bacterium]
MGWRVEYTDEFGAWWDTLAEDERVRITASVGLLERRGPNLGFPHSSGISGSRHGHMRELRVQVGGRPIRVFYAFDPRRVAILLIAGDKTGRDDFYARLIPLADRLYDEHLAEIAAEAARREQDDGG